MRKAVDVQELPTGIKNVVVAHGLGEPKAVYTQGSGSGFYLGGGLLASILGTAIITAYALNYEDTFAWWPVWLAVLIPLLGGVWLLLAVWFFLAPWLQPRLRVYVCREGLVYAAKEYEVLQWRQLERVWKIGKRLQGKDIAYRYLVRRSDERIFEFPATLPEVETLARNIEQEITQRLLPRAITAYNSGTKVLFDEIAVSKQGIIWGEGAKLLEWASVGQIVLAETHLELYERGGREPWARAELGHVPNVGVLRGLIAYAQRLQVQQQAPQIQAYKAGIPVDFGRLRISKQGLSWDGLQRLIPWNEIAGIGVGEHEVVIKRKGDAQLYTLPLWMVQDAPILRELVESILQGNLS